MWYFDLIVHYISADTFFRFTWYHMYIHSLGRIHITPNAIAQSSYITLLQHFGRLSAPTVIRSDIHFIDKPVSELLGCSWTRRNLMLAYCSEENAIGDRWNKVINRHIQTWDSWESWAALRNTEHLHHFLIENQLKCLLSMHCKNNS